MASQTLLVLNSRAVPSCESLSSNLSRRKMGCFAEPALRLRTHYIDATDNRPINEPTGWILPSVTLRMRN